MKNTLIYLLILFSASSSYLFGNEKLPFDLKVVGDDENQIDSVVNSILNDLSLRISDYYFGPD